MPQETALYCEFTIMEFMRYFGTLTGLPSEQIRSQINFLADLLILPSVNSKIKHLDYSEKKRVSFGLALLREPELLVLDEATFGLDTLYKEIIWKHLVYLTRKFNATVIITSSGIDELHNADIIGIMRKGLLVAEGSPETLLSRFEVETLECTFAKLSTQQDNRGVSNTRAHFNNFGLETDYVARYIVGDYLTDKNRGHIKVLVWKNFLWFIRYWLTNLSLIAIPLIQCAILFICYGRPPTDLDVAVVNYESSQRDCKPISCENPHVACNYVSYVADHFINLVDYQSETEALASVISGRHYASVVLRENYTAALKSRMNSWQDADNWDIFHSIIDVTCDFSKANIGTFLKLHFHKGFRQFMKEYMAACQRNRNDVSLPFQWKNDVYDIMNLGMTQYSSPGILLTTIFLLPVGLTAFSLMSEKREGVLDRTLNAGVRLKEILISHLISNVVIMVLLSLTITGTTIYLLNLTVNGPIVLVGALVLLTGFCGICAGYLLSLTCKSESSAILIPLASYVPCVCMSAILWPIQGMVSALRPLAYALPLTVPVEALRSIMEGGWGLTNTMVCLGFVTIILWIIVFVAICYFLVRQKD
ncbi:ABC transporter G family member 20-like isoform X2 [Photinus pyralis]|nr:ABC transporter G family member 20-like isoform X2 [Photinus pyralis]